MSPRWALALTLLLGCAPADGPRAEPLVCEAPLIASSQACVPPLAACGASSIPTTDGACVPVGVDACDPGFELVDGGCRGIGPDAPCGLGEVALPGERTCHALAACGDGTWGSIPLEPTTIFVDGSAAPDGDGTRDKPFRTLGAALAESGTREGAPQIAVAAGTYVEQNVAPHAVRVFGRCPALVELRAPDTAGAWALASGFPLEVHTLSVHGGENGGIVAVGVAVTGAPATIDFAVDRVHAHDGKSFGIGAQSGPRVVRVHVRDSLVEDNAEAGLAFSSGEALVERTVVRRIPALVKNGSNGILLAKALGAPAGSLVVKGSLVERAPYGIAVLAGRGSVEGTWVRDLLRPEGVEGGAGVSATGAPPSALTVRGSVIERAQQAGVFLARGSATLERVTIRDLIASPDFGIGEGVQALNGATLTMRRSLVTGCQGVGVFLGDGAALLESSIVRGVAGRVGHGDFGAGVAAQSDSGSSSLAVHDLWIDDTHVAGLQLNGASLDLLGALVTRVHAQSVDGLYGDGVAVQSAVGATGELSLGSATLRGLVVRDVPRAGVGVFGASVSLERSVIACSAFPISLSEQFTSSGARTHAVTIDDAGLNACGCSAWGACRAERQTLAPIPSFAP